MIRFFISPVVSFNEKQNKINFFFRFFFTDWITPLQPPSSTHNNKHADITTLTTTINNDTTIQALSARLQSELRAAKSRHLSCTEVLLPADLLHRVANEMVLMSEKEPCGIRGCSLFIEFEEEPSNTR